MSAVDVEEPDLQRFPDFANAVSARDQGSGIRDQSSVIRTCSCSTPRILRIPAHSPTPAPGRHGGCDWAGGRTLHTRGLLAPRAQSHALVVDQLLVLRITARRRARTAAQRQRRKRLSPDLLVRPLVLPVHSCSCRRLTLGTEGVEGAASCAARRRGTVARGGKADTVLVARA